MNLVHQVANVCAVPVKWKLEPLPEPEPVKPGSKEAKGQPPPVQPLAAVPKPYIVDHMEGVIAAAEERTVSVIFLPEEVMNSKFNLRLLIGDTEGLKPLETAQEIAVMGESFIVDVVPDFPGGARGLDFGDILVGNVVESKFQVG